MAPKRKEERGPVAEAIGFRINEGPRRASAPPFVATFLGEGVVSVEGVGLFTRWTSAGVDAATAARLRADPRWEVRPREDIGSGLRQPPSVGRRSLIGPAPDAPGAAP